MRFLMDNWMLLVAALASGGMLLWSLVRRSAPEVSPQAAVQLINREDAVLLDVREQAEFQAGRVRGAVHLPMSGLDAGIEKLSSKRDRPVIVYCQAGTRGATAALRLQQAGFARVVNLKGGLAAWREANLPLEN